MRKISIKSGMVDNQRKDRRLSLLTLTVEADGVEYNSLDWGMGGVRIDGVLPNLGLYSSLMIKVSGERRGRQLSFEVMATVVRIDTETEESGLRFDDLTAEDLDVLEAMITGRRITE